MNTDTIRKGGAEPVMEILVADEKDALVSLLGVLREMAAQLAELNEQLKPIVAAVTRAPLLPSHPCDESLEPEP